MNDTETWLGRDDMGTIAAGATVKCWHQGRLLIGVADHTTDGAWFTAEGGILVPAVDSVRFVIVAPEVQTLQAKPGTLIWAVTDTFEGAIEYRDDGWYKWPVANAPVNRTRVWGPGDPPMNLREWQLIRGEVEPA